MFTYKVEKNEHERVMAKYIKCAMVKNITCDGGTKLHKDENDIDCRWTWNQTTSMFEITVDNKKGMSSGSNIPSMNLGESDLIGYLRCSVGTYLDGPFHIDEPFVLKKRDVPNTKFTPAHASNKTTDNNSTIPSLRSLPSINPHNDTLTEKSKIQTTAMVGIIVLCLSGVGVSLFLYCNIKKKKLELKLPS